MVGRMRGREVSLSLSLQSHHIGLFLHSAACSRGGRYRSNFIPTLVSSNTALAATAFCLDADAAGQTLFDKQRPATQQIEPRDCRDAVRN